MFLQNWSIVTDAAMELTYTVPRLLEGNRYQFRVSAQNKFGVGVSTESDMISAKSSIGIHISTNSIKMHYSTLGKSFTLNL